MRWGKCGGLCVCVDIEEECVCGVVGRGGVDGDHGWVRMDRRVVKQIIG